MRSNIWTVREFRPILLDHLGDRLEEIPAVLGEVLNIVWPFVVWKVGWLPKDAYTWETTLRVTVKSSTRTIHTR
jgi:hypothetical protein